MEFCRPKSSTTNKSRRNTRHVPNSPRNFSRIYHIVFAPRQAGKVVPLPLLTSRVVVQNTTPSAHYRYVAKQAIALLSQEGSVIAFCDNARGGSLDEILQNA